MNVGPALVGVVVREFQAARAALGFLTLYGSQIFQMHLVMTAVAVLAATSSRFFLSIQALEALIARRHGSSSTAAWRRSEGSEIQNQAVGSTAGAADHHSLVGGMLVGAQPLVAMIGNA